MNIFFLEIWRFENESHFLKKANFKASASPYSISPRPISSPRPVLLKTPSLVDELLSEIYARFGDGFSTRMTLDSSQRASASGSQVCT